MREEGGVVCGSGLGCVRVMVGGGSVGSKRGLALNETRRTRKRATAARWGPLPSPRLGRMTSPSLAFQRHQRHVHGTFPLPPAKSKRDAHDRLTLNEAETASGALTGYGVFDGCI